MSHSASPFLLSSRHPPASQHGEVIEAFSPVFLNRHGYAHRHPALGLIGWDADGFIRWNPRQAAHVLDIRLSEILPGRSPFADNHPDRIEAVLMIIGTREQVEGSTPTILQTLKLTKTCICLLGSQALPLIFRTSNIQWIIVSNSSW